MVEGARSNSFQAGRTSLLCHSVDPWGASEIRLKGENQGKDPDWGWPLAYLKPMKKPQRTDTLTNPF